MATDTLFIQRCFDLARLGFGKVSPNPPVGAVLVHQHRIIGEGYHAQYGGPHAEVMAVNAVRPKDRPLIPKSTLYVSLEPCNIHGNTPPCTDLILREQIPRVVIAQRDFTPGVDGTGLTRLKAAGILVEEGLLRQDGFRLSLVRNVFVSQQRPYILLKFAKSRDGFMATTDQRQVWISNHYSKILVHKWRSETDAVLVGAQTAKMDNPALTTRHYPGKSPLRLVISRHNDLAPNSRLLNGAQPTWVFTQEAPASELNNVQYHEIDFTNANFLDQILTLLAQRKLSHLTVEGGAWLLQQFIEKGYWDEARILTGRAALEKGLSAPSLPYPPYSQHIIDDDQLDVIYNPHIWSNLYNR